MKTMKDQCTITQTANNQIQRKILIISDRVYPYFKGGAEKRYWEISKNLVKCGFKVCFLTGQWPGMKPCETVDDIQLIGVYEVKKFYVKGRKSIIETIKYTLNLIKYLAFEDYDLIDCEQFPILPIFVCKIFSILHKKNLVLTWHEYWGLGMWIKYLGLLGLIGMICERISVRLADRIISVSPHTTERLIGYCKVPRKSIQTIPNGIDFGWDRRSRYQKTRNILYTEKRIPIENSDIIFVGRLHEHKKVDILFHAINILKDQYPEILCLIIGDGPERGNLEQLSHKLNLKRNIEFKGTIANERRIYSYMQKSKVFVLPSVREGFGISVIEANACGLPAIVIDCENNASRDLIEVGKNGFTCGLCKDEMAQQILKILNTPRSKFYSICREIAKGYDWSDLSKQVANIYISSMNSSLLNKPTSTFSQDYGIPD